MADAIAQDFTNLTGAPSPLLDSLRGKIGQDISGRSYQAIQSEIQRYARQRPIRTSFRTLRYEKPWIKLSNPVCRIN